MTGCCATQCVHGPAVCLFDMPEILPRIKAFSYHIKTVEMVARGSPADLILSFFGVSLCKAPPADCSLCYADVHSICLLL